MKRIDRRGFLDRSGKTGLGLAAGITILANAGSVRGAPANEKVSLGLIGTGGRGSNLAAGFAERGDCQFVCLADPDTNRREALKKNLATKQATAPRDVSDLRKLLDDKSVDAVIVATPDHWHALAAVWACQAGKDVYVEKPPTHSAWEGQKMIEAAKKYNRVIEVGTQNRSAEYNKLAKQYIVDGKLGKIHFCRIFNQKSWPNFPDVADGPIPAGLDWDMWNGPAPEHAYNANFHRQWHHFWRYSSGDIINDGIHQMDLARWLLGVDYPKQVYSTGKRFEEGAAESPDTQISTFDFDDMVVTFELTLYTPYMLKISPYIRESVTEYPYWPQCATHIEIYGSKGVMYVGRHGGGWQVFERPVREKPTIVASGNGKFPDPEHKENFLQCVRRKAQPNAPIEEGHKSVLMAHYATMSYRLGGEKLVIDPKTEQVVGNDKAMAMFKREYRAPYVLPDQV
jgi:predicted dehydrogenase